jgi:hypothetical protein
VILYIPNHVAVIEHKRCKCAGCRRPRPPGIVGVTNYFLAEARSSAISEQVIRAVGIDVTGRRKEITANFTSCSCSYPGFDPYLVGLGASAAPAEIRSWLLDGFLTAKFKCSFAAQCASEHWHLRRQLFARCLALCRIVLRVGQVLRGKRTTSPAFMTNDLDSENQQNMPLNTDVPDGLLLRSVAEYSVRLFRRRRSSKCSFRKHD